MIVGVAYGYPAFPSPPAPPPRPSRGPLVLAALAGALVAAVVAAILVATGAVGDSGSGSGVGGSSEAITLPATVSGYQTFEAALTKSSSGGRAQQVIDEQRKVDAATAAALSKAHDGAGATTRSYASADLQTLLAVWAVRAPTPAPVVPYADAKYLRLAQPPRYVTTFGHSSCLINTQPTPEGQTPPKDATIVSLCQRSSDTLTITVVLTGGGGLASDPAKVAAIVDEVWNAVS